MSDFSVNFVSDLVANGLWVALYLGTLLTIKKCKKIRRFRNISRNTSVEVIANTPNPLYLPTGRPLPDTPINSFSLATLGHFYEEVAKDAPRKNRRCRSAPSVPSKIAEDRSSAHRMLTFPLTEAHEHSSQYQRIDSVTGQLFTPTMMQIPASPASSVSPASPASPASAASPVSPVLSVSPVPPVQPSVPPKVSLEEGRYGHYRPRQVTGFSDTYYSPPLLPCQTWSEDAYRPAGLLAPYDSLPPPLPTSPPPTSKKEERLYQLSTRQMGLSTTGWTAINIDIDV